jgi:hypothetical protein
VDYPETKQEFEGQIMIRKTDAGFQTGFKKLDYGAMPRA